MRIGAIGCGNVGLNSLRAFHKKGHEVFGWDISTTQRRKVADLFGSHAVIDPVELVRCDVALICVPTDPLNDTGEADTTAVENVVDDLCGYLALARCRQLRLVVQRSTCPPGTASRLHGRLADLGVHYAVNPSFLSKATQWEDSINPPRIAYSGNNVALALLDELYVGFTAPRYVSHNHETIELLRYAGWRLRQMVPAEGPRRPGL